MRNKYLNGLALYPKSVMLDACSMCQLSCPGCSTGRGENRNGIVGWGYLKFDDFKRFVDENYYIENIELSNWGEIFLNPELKKILLYGHIKGKNLSVDTGVNLNDADDEILESLVKYQVKVLRISIDGATNETYKKYRVNGNLNKVLRNIKKINDFKKKHNSEYPKLIWQFIIFGHNEHELQKAKKMASEFNMEFIPKLNLYRKFSPIKNPETVEKITGFKVTSHNIVADKIKINQIPCKQLWNQPQINWDGTLLGCCVNIQQSFGNVFIEGLRDSLEKEKYIYAKEMLLGRKPPRGDIVCSKCNRYKSLSELLDLEV